MKTSKATHWIPWISGILFSVSPLLAEETHVTVYSLNDIDALAEQNNVSLKALRLESRLNRTNEKSRLREMFPDLSLSYRRNRNIASRDFDTGSNSVQVSISQPLYDGGRARLAYHIAQIDSLLNQEKIRQTREQLRLEVRQRYFEILQAEQNIAILKESLKQYERFHRISEIEYKNGNIALLDILEIRHQLQQRTLTLQDHEADYRYKMATLGLMLHIPEDVPFRLQQLDLRTAGTEKLDLQSNAFIEQALQNRPEIRQAKMDLYRARRQYRITEYHYLPTISLTGNYGKTGTNWPPRETEWAVGINVTMNIMGNTISTDYRYLRSAQETVKGYSSGAAATLYDKPGYRDPHIRSQIELLRAREKYFEIERSLRIELQSLSEEYERRRNALQLQNSSTAVKEQRLRVMERLYRNGEISIDEFNKQELQLQEARFALVQKRFEYVLFIYRMEVSLGLNIGDLFELPVTDAESQNLWQPVTDLPQNDRPAEIPSYEELP